MTPLPEEPTHEQLTTFFHEFRAQHYDSVDGVMCIDSGVAGPTIGITAMTHGNEPAGLAAIYSILHEYDLPAKLVRGRVILAVNNLPAASRYFAAETTQERSACRFLTMNMNRIDLTATDEEELRRVKMLLPLWRQFDIGLDIHSTSQDAPPMLLAAGATTDLSPLQGLQVRHVIRNIDRIQIGKPAFAFYGDGTSAFEIEAGGHTALGTFDYAAQAAWLLLGNTGTLGVHKSPSAASWDTVTVFGSAIFPDNSYRLVRSFKNFEFVKAGTVVATGKGVSLLAPDDCCVLFSPDASRIASWDRTDEEAVFFAKKEG